MAGTITHAFFAMDVYDKLNKKPKKLLENYTNNLKTFGQGHDVFTFSKLKLSKKFHKNNTKDFFMNIIDYIKDNKLENNGEVLSFLYGFVCHYVLDKNVHPFVRYKTGVFIKSKKETYKYRNYHQDMESYIDSCMIRNRMNIKPGKIKSSKFCLKPYKFSDNLIKTIDYTFKKTYGYDNVGNIYYKGVKRMNKLYFLLRNDSFGIKNFAYNLVDKITPKTAFKFSPISFSYKEHSKDYYLNLENNEWNHAMDYNEKYTDSFYDIYNKSVDEAVLYINSLSDYFDGKKVNLNEIFKNISFATGKDCNDKRIEQYFEF